MSTAVHLPLAEYINTDYEPDCEYVDGVLEERNVGKTKHGTTQARRRNLNPLLWTHSHLAARFRTCACSTER